VKTIRGRISADLFISYLAVLVVGAVVLLFAVMFTAPGAYTRHMQMTAGAMIVCPIFLTAFTVLTNPVRARLEEALALG